MMLQFRRAALAAVFAAALAAPALAADFTLNVNTALTVDDPLFKGLEAFRDNVRRARTARSRRAFPGLAAGPTRTCWNRRVRALASRSLSTEAGLARPGGSSVSSARRMWRKTSTNCAGWSPRRCSRNGWPSCTASGHQILSFNWFQGQRHLLTNKAVTKPADLRVSACDAGRAGCSRPRALRDADPAGAEVYSAMQLKAIDAVEAHIGPFGRQALRAGEVHHQDRSYQPDHRSVGSRIWFDKLPADLQKVLRDEALKAGDIASKGTIDSLTRYEAQFREKGVTVAEIDTTPFRESTKAVYDKLGYGDLRKQVEAALAK